MVVTLVRKLRYGVRIISPNGWAVGAVRIINEKLNKMNESVIIQKLIRVGQMLERGELEYSGAEIDTKHYLEQYIALRQPHVVGQSEQCCSHPEGFYLGTTCPKCNKQFRSVKAE